MFCLLQSVANTIKEKYSYEDNLQVVILAFFAGYIGSFSFAEVPSRQWWVTSSPFGLLH